MQFQFREVLKGLIFILPVCTRHFYLKATQHPLSLSTKRKAKAQKPREFRNPIFRQHRSTSKELVLSRPDASPFFPISEYSAPKRFSQRTKLWRSNKRS